MPECKAGCKAGHGKAKNAWVASLNRYTHPGKIDGDGSRKFAARSSGKLLTLLLFAPASNWHS